MNFGVGQEVDHHTPYGDQLRRKDGAHFDTGNGIAVCDTFPASKCDPSGHRIYFLDKVHQYTRCLMTTTNNFLKPPYIDYCVDQLSMDSCYKSLKIAVLQHFREVRRNISVTYISPLQAMLFLIGVPVVQKNHE